MKKTREQLASEVDSLSDQDLKKMAYVFLKIKEHIWREFSDPSNDSESRRREKFRLKVAQKHITNWYNEY
jgi:hypothetical protein